MLATTADVTEPVIQIIDRAYEVWKELSDLRQLFPSFMDTDGDHIYIGSLLDLVSSNLTVWGKKSSVR